MELGQQGLKLKDCMGVRFWGITYTYGITFPGRLGFTACLGLAAFKVSGLGGNAWPSGSVGCWGSRSSSRA